MGMAVKKVEKIILQVNYLICMFYMLLFLFFPERESNVSAFDYWVVGYIFASTTILILKDAKRWL
jgi:hypothetical protein